MSKFDLVPLVSFYCSILQLSIKLTFPISGKQQNKTKKICLSPGIKQKEKPGVEMWIRVVSACCSSGELGFGVQPSLVIAQGHP